jgi:hypothetical protein
MVAFGGFSYDDVLGDGEGEGEGRAEFKSDSHVND